MPLANKKSQVTLFIMLAAIIGIMFMFNIYYRSYLTKQSIENEITSAVVKQSDFDPVLFYIESAVIDAFHYALSDTIDNLASGCSIALPTDLGCGIRATGFDDQPDPYLDIDIVPVPLTHTYGEYSFNLAGISSIREDIESYMKSYLANISFKEFQNRGFTFDKKGEPRATVLIAPETVYLTVKLPMDIRKGTKIVRIDTLDYKVHDRLGYFLRFNENMINMSETHNLSYDMTDQEGFQVRRTQGQNEEYDIITVTDESILLIDRFLEVSYVRENRPPDANSVYLSKDDSRIGHVLYNTTMTLNCPNYKTGQDFADPDEDDMYSYIIYDYSGLEDYDLMQCGNTLSQETVFIDADGCDVCSDLTVTVTDSGGLQDQKYFEDVVRCSPSGDKNSCCGTDGCWLEGKEGGCGYGSCPWTPVDMCTYTVCPPSACGAAVEQKTAVIKEEQYADMCTSCGDCTCSGSLSPRYRSTPCPQSQSCPPCNTGGGTTGTTGTTDGAAGSAAITPAPTSSPPPPSANPSSY